MEELACEENFIFRDEVFRICFKHFHSERSLKRCHRGCSHHPSHLLPNKPACCQRADLERGGNH